MAALDEYLKARREEIEAALEGYVPKAPQCPPVLVEAMRYCLMAGGKRLRPILTLASAEAVAARVGMPLSGARRLALPAACAVEMIHTYSLVHDDLPAMDDDVLRRGRATLHVVFGDGLAILAGDGLQAEAFALLAREPETSDPTIVARKLEALGVVARAAGPSGMVGGQAIDLEAVRPAPGRRAPAPFDAATLEAMHARKTGSLIRAAAVAGAIMAGGEPAETEAIDAYARELGLAFQIVDDILDVEGASERLGKTAGKDVAAGKPTYPAMYGVERSRQLAHDCLVRGRDALSSAGVTQATLGEMAEWVIGRNC